MKHFLWMASYLARTRSARGAKPLNKKNPHAVGTHRMRPTTCGFRIMYYRLPLGKLKQCVRQADCRFGPCEEERRSNSDTKRFLWMASCLAKTRSVRGAKPNYLTTTLVVVSSFLTKYIPAGRPSIVVSLSISNSWTFCPMELKMTRLPSPRTVKAPWAGFG